MDGQILFHCSCFSFLFYCILRIEHLSVTWLPSPNSPAHVWLADFFHNNSEFGAILSCTLYCKVAVNLQTFWISSYWNALQVVLPWQCWMHDVYWYWFKLIKRSSVFFNANPKCWHQWFWVLMHMKGTEKSTVCKKITTVLVKVKYTLLWPGSIEKFLLVDLKPKDVFAKYYDLPSYCNVN